MVGTNLLRSLGSRELRLLRVQWFVALPSMARSEPHSQWITAETEGSELKPVTNRFYGLRSCLPAECGLLLGKTENTEFWSSDHSPSLLPPAVIYCWMESESTETHRQCSSVSLGSSPPV
jgi:hypothetical protein